MGQMTGSVVITEVDALMYVVLSRTKGSRRFRLSDFKTIGT